LALVDVKKKKKKRGEAPRLKSSTRRSRRQPTMGGGRARALGKRETRAGRRRDRRLNKRENAGALSSTNLGKDKCSVQRGQPKCHAPGKKWPRPRRGIPGKPAKQRSGFPAKDNIRSTGPKHDGPRSPRKNLRTFPPSTEESKGRTKVEKFPSASEVGDTRQPRSILAVCRVGLALARKECWTNYATKRPYAEKEKGRGGKKVIV